MCLHLTSLYQDRSDNKLQDIKPLPMHAMACPHAAAHQKTVYLQAVGMAPGAPCGEEAGTGKRSRKVAPSPGVETTLT